MGSTLVGKADTIGAPMKIWLIAAVSADGKIAEKVDQSSLDWTSAEDTQFFVEKTKEAGVVAMGRTTFATIGKGLKDRRVIVMTKSPEAAIAIEGVEFTSESPTDLAKRLAHEGVETLALGGGASVCWRPHRRGRPCVATSGARGLTPGGAESR